MTEKNEFVENVWPENSALFIGIRPIELQNLNRLKTIDTFSGLGGPKVTHPTDMCEIPSLIVVF